MSIETEIDSTIAAFMSHLNITAGRLKENIPIAIQGELREKVERRLYWAAHYIGLVNKGISNFIEEEAKSESNQDD